MPKVLRRFLETFRGSSFPTRSELVDGSFGVVKMRGAGNGAASLVSEFVVNRLASAAGLAVPDASVVEIPAGLPWEFGTDEFDDLVRKSAGPNLGLAWLEGVAPVAARDYNALPHAVVSQVVTLDLLFGNCDRSFASGNLLRDRRGGYWLVDHGSCRFAYQEDVGPMSSRRLPPDHVFAGWEEAFDARWFEPLPAGAVARVMAELPELWLSEAGLSRERIAAQLAARLPARSE